MDLLLKEWRPEDNKEIRGHWLLKKAFLLNAFNTSLHSRENPITQKIETLLQTACDREQEPQERLWLLENLDLIRYGAGNSVKKESAQIEDLKRKSYYTLESVTDYFIREIEDKPEKERIRPADQTRNTRRTQTFGGIPPEKRRFWTSLTLISFVEESGMLFFINNVFWDVFWKGFTTDIRYKIFNNTYQDYTQMSLSYQFRALGHDANEDFIRKIMQTIVFNAHISIDRKKTLLFILMEQFTYRRKNDKSIREYLFPIAELMRIVPYQLWRDFWKELWDGITTPMPLPEWEIAQSCFFRGNVWSWRIPLDKMVVLLDDIEEVKSVLEYYFSPDNTLDYQELSAIKFNPHLKQAFEEKLKESEFKHNILAAFEREDNRTEKIRTLFRGDPVGTGQKLLQHLTDEGSINHHAQSLIEGLKNNTPESIEYFSSTLLPRHTNKDKTMHFYNWFPISLQSDIIEIVNKNEKQWNEYNQNHLISIIPKSQEGCDHIIEHIKSKIYVHIKKMPMKIIPPKYPLYNMQGRLFYIDAFSNDEKENLLQLYSNQWPSVKNFLSIEEMLGGKDFVLHNLLPFLNFIHHCKDSFDSNTQFDTLKNEVEDIYNQCFGINDWVKNLASNNIYDFVDLTGNLFRILSHYPQDRLKPILKSALSRIAIQSHVKNEFILEHLIIYLNASVHKKIDINWLTEPLLLILERYKKIPDENDRIFIECKMVRIARCLKKSNINDPIIQYWITQQKQSLFYEVGNLTDLVYEELP